MKKGLIAILLAAVLLTAAGAFAYVRQQQRAEKQQALEEAAVLALPSSEAQTEAGQVLLDAWRAVCRAKAEESAHADGDLADRDFLLTTLDTQALAADLSGVFTARQRQWV